MDSAVGFVVNVSRSPRKCRPTMRHRAACLWREGKMKENKRKRSLLMTREATWNLIRKKRKAERQAAKKVMYFK